MPLDEYTALAETLALRDANEGDYLYGWWDTLAEIVKQPYVLREVEVAISLPEGVSPDSPEALALAMKAAEEQT